MTAAPRGNPASRIVSLASICLAAAAAGPAGAQIHGSLEKLIVELPSGCSSRATTTQPGGSGTFSFSYACKDQHDVVFTVSFPATVEAKSFDGLWYVLDDTPDPQAGDGSRYRLDASTKANASASASWQWKTLASPPGGLFQSSSLRLYLGTYLSSAPSDCSAPEVLTLLLAPGTHTSAASQPCGLKALAAWNSGEPGDTVPWASYWAEAQFNAFYTNLSAVFPSQKARARAVYRMGDPPRPDLAVEIGGRHAFLWEDDPAFPIVVTNRGTETAFGARLDVAIANPLGFGEVIGESPSPLPGCTWSLADTGAYGSCPLGNIQAGGSVTVDLELRLADLEQDQYMRVSAEAFPTDDPAANNRDEQTVAYLRCAPYQLGTLEECAVHVLACRAAASPAVSAAGSAPLAGVGRATAVVRALATSPIDVGSFRRLRDEIMAGSAAGRRLAALYDEHTTEIVALAVANADLLAALIDGVLLWQPHVQALVDGDGDAVITAEQIAALQDVLARLKALGSAELRTRILREEAALDLPWFVGRTMAQARTRAEATPLRRRLPAAGS